MPAQIDKVQRAILPTPSTSADGGRWEIHQESTGIDLSWDVSKRPSKQSPPRSVGNCTVGIRVESTKAWGSGQVMFPVPDSCLAHLSRIFVGCGAVAAVATRRGTWRHAGHTP